MGGISQDIDFGWIDTIRCRVLRVCPFGDGCGDSASRLSYGIIRGDGWGKWIPTAHFTFSLYSPSQSLLLFFVVE